MAAAGVDKHFVVCPGIYIARARPVWKVFMKEFGEDYQLFKRICHDGCYWEIQRRGVWNRLRGFYCLG